MPRLELVVLLAAEREILGLYQALEEHRPGLGANFIEVIETAFERLKSHPEHAPAYRRGYRRLLIRPYHLGLFYRLEGRRIVVVDLLDLRQEPASILRRLGL